MFGPSRRDLHRALERERLRNQQREAELLDRLLYAVGKPWTPPPASETTDRPEPVYVSALEVLPEEWDAPPDLGDAG